ncbi:helix-turn-helix transcriptional regulator [Pararhodobacter sp.]|uniref:helix-turn-helix domain-containing protein n=1 Tax=Pararhodobacter sp. TaxID=2127056 RepID=UPI002AFE5ECD|nr:helix-turn-helix transcriptional regulator [Pararhodobacter sp.]
MAENWYSEEHATLGDRLAAAREAAGMSANECAQRIGVRAKTFSDWENDVSEPRANQLQMLTALLNVSLRWLLTGEGGDISLPDAQHTELDSHLKATLGELRQVRADMLKMGERLGRLEKSLRVQMTRSLERQDGMDDA